MTEATGKAPAPPRLAAPYRDLTKANDLVTRSFPSGGAFSLSTETRAGDASVKTSVRCSNKDHVSATISPAYDWRAQHLSFEGSFSTTNAFFVKGTVKDLGTKGLNLSLRGDRITRLADDNQLAVLSDYTAGIQYGNQHVHLLTEARLVSTSDVAVSAAIHGVPHDNVGVGLKVDYSTRPGAEGKQVTTVTGEGKLVGRFDQIEGALTCTSKQVLGVHFWHELSKDFQWAATVAYPLAEDTKEVPVVNVAANYKLDDFTTGKGRVTAYLNKGEVKPVYRSAFSAQQKINLNTSVTVGADVNLNHVFGTKDGAPTACGFELSFK